MLIDAMTTPFICVLVAYLLIYLPKLPLSAAMAKQPGGYDNKDPRGQQAKLDGWGARARAAHYNGFEAFPGCVGQARRLRCVQWRCRGFRQTA